MADRLDIIDRDWQRRFGEAGVLSSEALRLLPASAPPVAASRTSRTEIVEVAGIPLHRKVYVYPEMKDRWRAALRGTLFGAPRARREWAALRALGDAGLPAVEPVALGIERRGGFVRASVLVTRTEIDAVPLDTFVQRGERLEEILTRVASILATAHEKGHRLGRPAPRDMLVLPEETTPGLRLLDLPRHRRGRRMAPLESARDLARIAAGLIDRVPHPVLLRTLEVYARQRVSLPDPARALATHIGREMRPYREGERRRAAETR